MTDWFFLIVWTIAIALNAFMFGEMSERRHQREMRELRGE